MLTFIKEVLVDFAKSSSAVKGLVLLGSVAIGNQTETSDLDVLFVIAKEKEESEFQRDLSKIFHVINKNADRTNDVSQDEGHICMEEKLEISVKTQLFMTGKTVIYLSDGKNKIYKVDAGHTKDVMDHAKFIVGSEIKLRHLEDIILLDYIEKDGTQESDNQAKDETKEGNETTEGNVGQIYHQLKRLLRSHDPYKASGLRDADPIFHILEFVDRFDSCLSSILKEDQYRVEFYLFILRHRLLCLQMLLQLGVREHIYLPKQAYQNGAIEMFCIETESPLLELEKLLKAFGNINISSIEMNDMFNSEMFQDYINLLHEKVKSHKQLLCK